MDVEVDAAQPAAANVARLEHDRGLGARRHRRAIVRIDLGADHQARQPGRIGLGNGLGLTYDTIKQLDEARKSKTQSKTLVRHEPLRNVVIFDVLSSEKIIREPISLYDAWVQSIMIPLVEIAKDDIKLFESNYNKDWGLNLMRIRFDIGYAAGQKFFEKHKHVLQPPAEAAA